MNKTFKRSAVATAAAGAFGLLASGMASATSTAIDVSAVTTSIADQAAPIALIGAAVLLLTVGIKAFKWVRRALT